MCLCLLIFVQFLSLFYCMLVRILLYICSRHSVSILKATENCSVTTLRLSVLSADMCLLLSDEKPVITLSCNTAIPRDTITTWLLFEQLPGKHSPFHPAQLCLYLTDTLWSLWSEVPIPLAKISSTTVSHHDGESFFNVILTCMTQSFDNHQHSCHFYSG